MNVKVIAKYDLRPWNPVTEERDPEGVEKAACDRCASGHYIVVEMMVDGKYMEVGTACAQKLLGKKVLTAAVRRMEHRKDWAPRLLGYYRGLKASIIKIETFEASDTAQKRAEIFYKTKYDEKKWLQIDKGSDAANASWFARKLLESQIRYARGI